jgi:hypothetical protein
VNGVVAWVGPVGGMARPASLSAVTPCKISQSGVATCPNQHIHTSSHQKGSCSRLSAPPQAAVMSGEMSEGSRDIRVVEPVSNSPRETGGGIGQSWPVQRISARPVGEPYATSLIFRSSRPIAAEQLYQQRTVIRSETKRPAGEGA